MIVGVRVSYEVARIARQEIVDSIAVVPFAELEQTLALGSDQHPEVTVATFSLACTRALVASVQR